MAVPDFQAAILDAYPTLTTAQKAALQNDFCAMFGYRATIPADETVWGGLEKPNPETKKAFFNRQLTRHLKGMINTWRRNKAIESVVYDEFLSTENLEA
jgi:hypothetical protein